MPPAFTVLLTEVFYRRNTYELIHQRTVSHRSYVCISDARWSLECFYVWEAKKISRKRVRWLIVCFKTMPRDICNAEALQQENKQTNKGKNWTKTNKKTITLFVNPLRCQIKYAHLHTLTNLLSSISTLMVSVTSAFTVLFCLLGDRFELFIQPLFEQIVFNVQLLLTSHVHCIYTKICQEKKQM